MCLIKIKGCYNLVVFFKLQIKQNLLKVTKNHFRIYGVRNKILYGKALKAFHNLSSIFGSLKYNKKCGHASHLVLKSFSSKSDLCANGLKSIFSWPQPVSHTWKEFSCKDVEFSDVMKMEYGPISSEKVANANTVLASKRRQ